jgi:hypothetical protein
MVSFETPTTPPMKEVVPIPYVSKRRKQQPDSSPEPSTGSSYITMSDAFDYQILTKDQSKTAPTGLQQDIEKDIEQGQVQKIESAKILLNEVISQLQDQEVSMYIQNQIEALSRVQQRITDPTVKLEVRRQLF